MITNGNKWYLATAKGQRAAKRIALGIIVGLMTAGCAIGWVLGRLIK